MSGCSSKMSADASPPTQECTVCSKSFCPCPSSRCQNGQAALANCNCRGWCNECLFNWSRNTGLPCCCDSGCENRLFICPQCDAPQHFHTASNQDVSHKLWGRKEDGRISYEY